ncbi:Ankyrin-1 [Tetrabaena socialis]|uniref:Ankyrin-1 n=1 Tax=Tetrabaena socialis TaxID=47790 RepID=A0A2J8AK53_9CHLO|nr:Ankyrin-1 [Tetrabaena socialis]|eukprot:PNH12904.1 Ankyrin-1 [Tetrabaena socialis]
MDPLECPVCREKYNVADRAPAVAPCGHSLCRTCLGRLQRQHCPECRGRLPNSLPRNFALCDILEARAEAARVQQSSPWSTRTEAERGQQPSSLFIPAAELQLTSEELGAGATGRVVCGSYKSRQVAVKLLPLAGPAFAREALQKELGLLARALSGCCRVAKLLGISVLGADAAGLPGGGQGGGEGRLALVMRRYPNSLAQHVAALPGGALPPGAVLLLAVDLLRALAQLHVRGITMADLRPGNVLLEGADMLLLCGAGNTHAFTSYMGPHLPALKPGALNYMCALRFGCGARAGGAPEQFGFQPGTGVTAKSDMWALGATLLHVLAGRPPHADLDLAQIVLTVGWHRRAPELPPGLPPALHRLLSSCLRAVPDERPSTWEALAMVVDALGAAAGQPGGPGVDAGAPADAQAGSAGQGPSPAAAPGSPGVSVAAAAAAPAAAAPNSPAPQASGAAAAAVPPGAPAVRAPAPAQHDRVLRPAEVGDELVLLWASKHGYMAEVERLLGPGTLNPNVHDEVGGTALHWASHKGYTRVAVALLQARAHVSDPDQHGMTPLHAASLEGHRDVAEALVQHGARLEARGKKGACLTPLDCACHNGHAHVVALLLQHRAQVDPPQGKGGFKPLHWASKQGHAEVARLLVQAGARTDATTKPHVVLATRVEGMLFAKICNKLARLMTTPGGTVPSAVRRDPAEVARAAIRAAGAARRDHLLSCRAAVSAAYLALYAGIDAAAATGPLILDIVTAAAAAGRGGARGYDVRAPAASRARSAAATLHEAAAAIGRHGVGADAAVAAAAVAAAAAATAALDAGDVTAVAALRAAAAAAGALYHTAGNAVGAAVAAASAAIDDVPEYLRWGNDAAAAEPAAIANHIAEAARFGAAVFGPYAGDDDDDADSGAAGAVPDAFSYAFAEAGVRHDARGAAVACALQSGSAARVAAVIATYYARPDPAATATAAVAAAPSQAGAAAAATAVPRAGRQASAQRGPAPMELG